MALCCENTATALSNRAFGRFQHLAAPIGQKARPGNLAEWFGKCDFNLLAENSGSRGELQGPLQSCNRGLESLFAHSASPRVR